MKAIEAAARALSPHLRFYGDGQGHAVTIADKTIKAYLTALAEDDAAVEKVADAIYDESGGEVSWKHDLARAALRALTETKP